MTESNPNPTRKLFFGLFVFPLVIAVGMAVLLCTVVFLTNERETPESLIADIKTGTQSKRWQKAFELSNELNLNRDGVRSEAVRSEIIHILGDSKKYDSKTRGYMALALSHFKSPESAAALRGALKGGEEDVLLYSIWALGSLGAREAAPDLLPFALGENADLKKVAVYVLGVLGDASTAPKLRPLLDDASADVRWNAALALARLGDDAAFPVLAEMLQHDQLKTTHGLDEANVERVMINATKGMALIRKPDSIKILETIAREDVNLRVRQAALDAISYQKSSSPELNANR